MEFQINYKNTMTLFQLVRAYSEHNTEDLVTDPRIVDELYTYYLDVANFLGELPNVVIAVKDLPGFKGTKLHRVVSDHNVFAALRLLFIASNDMTPDGELNGFGLRNRLRDQQKIFHVQFTPNSSDEAIAKYLGTSK